LAKLLRAAKIVGWWRKFPLIGKPDFVFPASRVALFVDGCFWHGHDCGRNLTPKRNAKAWNEKIAANRRRDRRVERPLRASGWRIIRVWECSLRRTPQSVLSRIQRTLGVPRTEYRR